MAEPVISAVKKYREELEETYDGLRQRATQFQDTAKTEMSKYADKATQLQPQIQKQREEMVETLKDFKEPVEDASVVQRLMESLLWVTTMQFGYHVSFLFLGGLFASLVGLVFDTFTAMLLAYVLLPVAAVLHVKNRKAEEADRVTRFKLLAFGLLEGVLTGFLLSDSYLGIWQPLPFVSTGVAAAAAPIVLEKLGKNRQSFLGATVGAGVGVQLVLGLFTGSLSFTYLLLTLLYAGIAFATIQFYLKYAKGDAKNAAYYAQLGYFLAAVLAQGFVYGVFSMSGQKYQEYRQGEVERHADRQYQDQQEQRGKRH